MTPEELKKAIEVSSAVMDNDGDVIIDKDSPDKDGEYTALRARLLISHSGWVTKGFIDDATYDPVELMKRQLRQRVFDEVYGDLRKDLEDAVDDLWGVAGAPYPSPRDAIRKLEALVRRLA